MAMDILLYLLTILSLSSCTFVQSISSQMFCISPSTEITQENKGYQSENTMDGMNCSLTLEQVLQNHEEFFVSNTTLQLLPGTHEVSKSFGSIVVRNIHNFAMIGTACNANNDTWKCSKIECTGSGSLGMTFITSVDVKLSEIFITNCTTRNAQLISEFDIFRNGPLMYREVNRSCTLYTFLLLYSSGSVVIDQMTFEHSTPNETCFIAVGIVNFKLQYTSFLNFVKCYINPWDTVHPKGKGQTIQTYELNSLSFALIASSHGQLNTSTAGIKLQSNHKSDLVDISLKEVSLNCRSLEISLDNEFGFGFSLTLELYNLTIVGNSHSCYGLTLEPAFSFSNTYEMMIMIELEHIHLIKSNMLMDFGKCNTHVREREHHVVKMSDISIEQVPCNCRAAFSVTCSMLTVHNLTLTNSCSRYNLVNLRFTVATFASTNRFSNNQRTCIAAAISAMFFEGDTLFNNNVAEENSGSTVLLVTAYITVQSEWRMDSRLRFSNNTGASCGGIMARENSIIYVYSTLVFTNNRGYNGGALALYEHSMVEYRPNGLFLAKVNFTENSAEHSGGAVYISDEGYEQRTAETSIKIIRCAFSVENFRRFGKKAADRTIFVNNTALDSGSALYGGWIDICEFALDSIVSHCPLRGAKYISNPEDFSVVSSTAARVCICINSTPQCNITEYEYKESLYPGQPFQIETVAVGQRFGTTPSTVSASFVNTSIKVNVLQKLQNVDKFCTILNYTVKSPNAKEKLLLTINRKDVPDLPIFGMPLYTLLSENISQDLALLRQQFKVNIQLRDCPLGYRFNHSTYTCSCNKKLQTLGAGCNTAKYSVFRTKHQWINITFEHIDNYTEDHGVLVHHHCPLDYCISQDQTFKLEIPSDQCNFKRSGTLCGSCQGNLSQIFGTNRCKECSSMMALLVVPVFILLGVALVVFIIALNFTVAQGTINALIFYANIVSANQAVFFTTQTTNTFFRWYIAWLNLDVGIETCFISGLDAYVKTWLQFLFPIYIWILVILIIMASRYSTLAAKLSGENAVPALATLFLLSYTKLLRIIITTFSSTQLEYPDGYIRRVWLYDGNVDFLEPKHVALFVAVFLLLIFLSAPYTLVLFTIQWLQRLPYHCVLSWVWKLKPLFDAHTGPFKEKHRYWPGLLLLVRVALFIAFSLNINNDPALNLLVTSITVISLCAYLAYVGGVHENIYLDILEYMFLLNILVSTVAIFYTTIAEGNQDAVIKTSVSIAITISLVIVLGHVYLKVKSIQKGVQFINAVHTKLQLLFTPIVSVLNRFCVIDANNPRAGIQLQNLPTTNNPTHTRSAIELREPLMVQ